MDIRNFLTTKGIYFVEGGKGVGLGNISIPCPKCGHPNNFSINLEGKGYHCWSCNFAGKSYTYLLRRLGIKNFIDFEQVTKELKKKEITTISLPDFAFPLSESIIDLEVTKTALEFLQLKKGFDLQLLKQCCNKPPFKMYVSFNVDFILGNRIFLPLYLTTEKSIGFYSRYYLVTNSPIKHYTKGNCLYNFPFLVESNKKLLIIHESCLDAYKWNMLSTVSVASASLTNRFSLFQLKQLKSVSNSFEKIIILLDNDSESKSITLRTLTNLTKLEIPNLIIINIKDFCNEKDFGDLSHRNSIITIQEIEKMAFNFRKRDDGTQATSTIVSSCISCTVRQDIIQKASEFFKITFIDSYLKFCIQVTQKVIDKEDLENDLKFFILLCKKIEEFVSTYKITPTFNEYLKDFFTENFPKNFNLIETKWTNDDPLVHEFVRGMYNVCGLEEPILELEEPILELEEHTTEEVTSEKPTIDDCLGKAEVIETILGVDEQKTVFEEIDSTSNNESHDIILSEQEQLGFFKFNLKHKESSLVTIFKEHCPDIINGSVDIDLATLDQLLIISMEYYNDNVCETPPPDLINLIDYYKIFYKYKAKKITLTFGDTDLSVITDISVNQELPEKIEEESNVFKNFNLDLETLLKSLISKIENSKTFSSIEKDLIVSLVTALSKRIL